MMRHEELESICRTLETGADRRVRHIVLHQIGKVIACQPDDFVEVELENGEHKSWSKDNITLLQ